MWYPISQLFKLLIKFYRTFIIYLVWLRDFEGAIVRTWKDHLSSFVGREFTWFTVLIVLRCIVRILLLHITYYHNIIAIHHINFGFFSINYYWISHFLVSITCAHYCAFLNCFTFFRRRGHILLNCWELVNNGQFNRSNSFWSYESWKQNPGIPLIRFPWAAFELSWSLSLSFFPLSWVRRGHPLAFALAFSWKKLDKIQIRFFIFQLKIETVVFVLGGGWYASCCIELIILAIWSLWVVRAKQLQYHSFRC